jgi:mannitol/fructose-specific phosphotransferase system IIA component (Ntr-type)
MSALSAHLYTRDVHLELRSTNCADALEEILSPLRRDARIRDWEKLRSSLLAGTRIEASLENRGTMILHHGRTESVSGLVLALGRSRAGLPNPGEGPGIHLLVVAAIPETLNNEYLRIIGAIARVCGHQETFRKLLEAAGEEDIKALLEKACLE